MAIAPTIITIIILVIASLNIQLASSQSITRDRCELDPNFVFIPAGDFIAGSDRTEREYGYYLSAQSLASTAERIPQVAQQLQLQAWFERESPRQRQSLPAFCIRRNLITNADYQAFILATGHRSPGISEAEYQEQGFLVHSYDEVQNYLWVGSDYPSGTDQHPVVLISYRDAIAYAQWKGQQDQKTYRLPTVEEWEKAARGTDGRYFPWGNQWQDEATNWAGSGINGTSAIATFLLSRSLYDVEDMAGNVFEYTSTLQRSGIQTLAVMKGCSWDDSPGFCRAAYQHTRPINSRHILFGFRLIQE
ncbi:MAG: formylglycine-generating enzyme family protein [Leptolyngbyaceae cyanobacterium RM1_406_9]|nr:formylglycine-generating enzyme family protein [Leptolyngbyaceae cyanobacterium SL_5_14]NJO75772.1 formylglycine-generating enzyme family protein [Leptolyngbyaceae cyanobacterium RM1_406_9]